jgi:hypothetical protein
MRLLPLAALRRDREQVQFGRNDGFDYLTKVRRGMIMLIIKVEFARNVWFDYLSTV